MSRHLYENGSTESIIKAEELCHIWFTVNELTRKDTSVSANQNRRGEEKQPIGEKLATASEPQARVKVESADSVNNSEDTRKRPIKLKLNLSESKAINNALMLEADNPPSKTPQCYAINQIVVLQSLEKFAFASQSDSEEFLQKVIGLITKPDSTKINRLPTSWREKFRCLSSLVDRNFI